MRRVLASIIGIFLAVFAYIFDVWNLQAYLEAKKIEYWFRFPPADIWEYVLWLVLLFALISTFMFAYYLFPRVSISGLKKIQSKIYDEWYGVYMVRRGFDCACTAQAELSWYRMKPEPIQFALRTKNQWEQSDKRDREIAPFNLRQIKKFVPIFMIKIEKDTPYLVCLDQTEEQWINKNQGLYQVEVSVTHGSLKASKKRFYLDFDGEQIRQISRCEYKRKGTEARKQQTIFDIYGITKGPPINETNVERIEADRQDAKVSSPVENKTSEQEELEEEE